MGVEMIRRQAASLGVRHTEQMNKHDLIRAIQAMEGKQPCFDRQRCRASQLHRCDWRHECRAEPETVRGLILSDNIVIGHQLLTMLTSEYGWKMTFVHSDREAYALIMNGDIDVVIADINGAGLGALAVLAYTKDHWPSILTYAIARNDDPFLKKLARNMGGCLGFFYRVKGRIELDIHTGVAPELLSQLQVTEEPRIAHAAK